MSNPLMLILGGIHVDSLGNEHRLMQHASLYHYLFSRIMPVQTRDCYYEHQLTTIFNQLAHQDYDLVYLVFIGEAFTNVRKHHVLLADGSLFNLPATPLNFIQNNRQRPISFRIIFDWLHVLPIVLRPRISSSARYAFTNDSDIQMIDGRLKIFLSFPFNYITVSRNVVNYPQDANATIFNSSLLEAIINVDAINLDTILMTANARLHEKLKVHKRGAAKMKRLIMSEPKFDYSLSDTTNNRNEWIILPSSYAINLSE